VLVDLSFRCERIQATSREIRLRGRDRGAPRPPVEGCQLLSPIVMLITEAARVQEMVPMFEVHRYTHHLFGRNVIGRELVMELITNVRDHSNLRHLIP
jgi:hypothetical protein